MIPTNLQPYLDDHKLFLTALTHRSYCNEHPKTEHNERMEFLGDAVLEYLMSKELYVRFPEHPEGVLTAMRSKLVQTASLALIAEQLDLGEHLRLSRGEEAGGGRLNPALLENALEALIGAIYLDRGMQTTHKFLSDHLFPHIDTLSLENLKDPKSLFQEMVQAQGHPTPTYELVEATGPDHDKTFTMAVIIKGEEWGRGEGNSKLRASQEAAKEGLKKLEKP